MNTGKVLLGLVAGFAAGATLGIVFAPDKGTSTRKRFAQKKDASVEEMEAKFNGLINRLSQKYETLKEKTIQLAENTDEELQRKEQI